MSIERLALAAIQKRTSELRQEWDALSALPAAKQAKKRTGLVNKYNACISARIRAGDMPECSDEWLPVVNAQIELKQLLARVQDER